MGLPHQMVNLRKAGPGSPPSLPSPQHFAFRGCYEIHLVKNLNFSSSHFFYDSCTRILEWEHFSWWVNCSWVKWLEMPWGDYLCILTQKKLGKNESPCIPRLNLTCSFLPSIASPLKLCLVVKLCIREATSQIFLVQFYIFGSHPQNLQEQVFTDKETFCGSSYFYAEKSTCQGSCYPGLFS